MRTKLTIIAALAAAVFAVGCGGPSKTGKKGMSKMAAGAPPPPSGSNKAIDRKVTREAKKDFAEAYAFYQEQAKAGWSEETCTAAARRFQQVASDHDKLVEARFNAGLSLHQCGMLKDAEAEYQLALKINPGHARSLAGLGEIYYRGGNSSRGVQYWEKAVAADQKAVAARNNLAWHLLGKLRDTNDRAAWRKFEEEAKTHLSSALAVDTDNVEAYVIYALVFMEGSERNKSRLDIANVLLDEGAKRRAEYAPLWNARGLLELRKDNVGRALTHFERAVQLDPRFAEARLNVGNIVLGFRKYDVAKEQFEAVLQMQPKSYDAQVGLGIALRGIGDLDAAEAAYKAAAELDPQKGAAYYNLGVLYKDFRASSAPNEQATLSHYKQARTFFKQYVSKNDVPKSMRKDAQDQIEDSDKYVKQLEEIIQMKQQMEQQQPEQPAEAAPAAGGASS